MCNRSSGRSRPNQGNQETKDNSELSDNDDYHPRPTTHFPFGMTQIPFQIMNNWPLKFRNNKEDSPAHFLEDLKRFRRGYQINNRDILENLDALLIEDAKDWCLNKKNPWRALSDFLKEFTKTYTDKNL